MIIRMALHLIFGVSTTLLFLTFLFVTGVTLFEVETVLNNLPAAFTVLNTFIAFIVALALMIANFVLAGNAILR